MSPRPRPEAPFDVGLQHERTALAWERTAIATMVSGVLLARYAATSGHLVLAFIGLAQTAGGGVLLFWASLDYERVDRSLRAAESVVQPTITRLVGFTTVFFIGASLTLAVTLSLTG